MRKSVLIAAVAALAISVPALAAWVVYNSIATGSAGSGIASPGAVNALAFSSGAGAVNVVPCTAGSGAACTGGTQGQIAVNITNNDPGTAHAASGLTITLTSSGSGCAAHLFVTGSSNLTQTVPAGGEATNGSVSFVADPSTPTSCGGASVTATITGTAT